MPFNCAEYALYSATAASNVVQVEGSSADALFPVFTSLGILVGFPLRTSSRHTTQHVAAFNSGGTASNVLCGVANGITFALFGFVVASLCDLNASGRSFVKFSFPISDTSFSIKCALAALGLTCCSPDGLLSGRDVHRLHLVARETRDLAFAHEHAPPDAPVVQLACA